MKTTIKSFIFLISLFLTVHAAEAQLLKKVKDRVTQTTEDKVVNKAGQATGDAMDKAEEDIKGSGKPAKEKKTGGKNEKTDGSDDQPAAKSTTGKAPAASIAAYSNYDFVPGDKLIYFYDMAGEKDAEIPGRMLIDNGSAEIQTYKGEKILFVPANGTLYMHPHMKENAYLPGQFTLEFDMLSNGGIETTADISEIILYFRGKDNTAGSHGNATAPIRIRLSAISGDESAANYGFEVFNEADDSKGTASQRFPPQAVNSAQDNWRRIAIYVNNNIGKLYIDQHRIGISNQVESGNAAKLDIEVITNEHPVLFKNFRIAAGGADSYNKVITDGKFIAYGIQFDVNKAILKPESMGTINEFVKMMKENTDLKFEIGGHTDSDGTAERNNVLSQERADAVKKQMVSMGVAAVRLSTKGYGSAKSIAENNSAENKAKNRRVEFVKQ